ncbi:MAG: excisionase family DNA-binding protein [Blastocatellia bacterium]
MNLITTSEAAERLGVTIRRIQALITDGRLPAQKVGRDYLIKDEDLKLVTDRKPGRPRKPKTATIENTANKGKRIK